MKRSTPEKKCPFKKLENWTRKSAKMTKGWNQKAKCHRTKIVM